MVTLIGLSAKNAILIVEFANTRYEAGTPLIDAAIEAARLRFRPIIMTSMAFIFGMFPLVIATGAGAASRQSIGTGVLGGMLAATFLAIFFVPLFYVLIRKLTGRIPVPSRGVHEPSRLPKGEADMRPYAIVVLSALLMSCAMGPDYEPPPGDTDDRFRMAEGALMRLPWPICPGGSC